MKMRKMTMRSQRGEKKSLAENVRVVADAPIHGEEYQPRVMLFYGRRGNGKSLLATAFAKTHADRWHKAGAPKRVLTNYDVAFSDHVSADLYAEMTLGDIDTTHCIIVFDEVAELMPSMRANTREALDMQSWLKGIRKQGADMFMTTQRPHEILGSVRYQTDFFISCKDPYRRDPKRKGRVVEASIFDWWGAISEYPFGSNAPFPQPDENAHWRRKYFNLNAFWQYYDTREVIRGTYATANRGHRDKLLAKASSGQYAVGEPLANQESLDKAAAIVAHPYTPLAQIPDKPPSKGMPKRYSEVNELNIRKALPKLRAIAGQPDMTPRAAMEFAAMMGDANI